MMSNPSLKSILFTHAQKYNIRSFSNQGLETQVIQQVSNPRVQIRKRILSDTASESAMSKYYLLLSGFLNAELYSDL